MVSQFTVNFIWLISECREYDDAKYEKRWTTIGFNDRPILEKILNCISLALVVGGENALPNEFPHMVFKYMYMVFKNAMRKMNFYEIDFVLCINLGIDWHRINKYG